LFEGNIPSGRSESIRARTHFRCWAHAAVARTQLWAARGLTDWSQGQLAAAANLSLATIKRMEGAAGPGKSSAANVEAVQRALEAAGVEFIAETGVRLKEG